MSVPEHGIDVDKLRTTSVKVGVPGTSLEGSQRAQSLVDFVEQVYSR